MINFNELLAKDLAEYLDENQTWFLRYNQLNGYAFLSKEDLQEAISSYFKQHEDPVPALLRKKD